MVADVMEFEECGVFFPKNVSSTKRGDFSHTNNQFSDTNWVFNNPVLTIARPVSDLINSRAPSHKTL